MDFMDFIFYLLQEYILWEIFMEIFDRKYVNLSNKFGERILFE